MAWFSEDSLEFGEVDGSTAEANPYVQEFFDSAEPMVEGYQCEVRADDRVYKVFKENIVSDMLRYASGSDIGIEERVEAEVNASRLEEIGINVPSIINRYDNVVEMERLDGVNFKELVDSVDDYDSLKEIGAVAGSQLDDMVDHNFVKLDYVFENIWAETSNLQDESDYNLQETFSHTSKLPSNPNNDRVPVFQIDNELLIENPSKREIMTAEILFLSGIKDLDSKKSTAIEEGFKSEYGEVSDAVEIGAQSRAQIASVFFNFYDRIAK